jgi:ribonuclease HII
MNLDIERSYIGEVVAGIDEAGRGPLAGPVVAAAVIIDQSNIVPGIDDSKKLSQIKRDWLYQHIIENYQYSVAVIQPQEIDEINILQATIKACILAERNLHITPNIVLVDGNMKFSDPRFISIVKGDAKSISIAAASIIAKVTRDRLMEELHHNYPMYNWRTNKGYGTKEHIDAIMRYGRTIHHRESFQFKIKG